MTRNEAIKVVVEVANFWRSEDLRLGREREELTDHDAVTCADITCLYAVQKLGERLFLELFNDEYLA